MFVSEELLIKANEVLIASATTGRVNAEIASISCSYCGAGCSGIVGD